MSCLPVFLFFIFLVPTSCSLFFHCVPCGLYPMMAFDTYSFLNLKDEAKIHLKMEWLSLCLMKGVFLMTEQFLKLRRYN